MGPHAAPVKMTAMAVRQTIIRLLIPLSLTREEYTSDAVHLPMTITLLWIAAIALIVVGIAGSILPALPGAPLVFAGLMLAAWIDDFSEVGWLPLTVAGVLMLLTFVVDFAATALGAKRVGASGFAVAGAAIGTVVGIFGGLIGIVLGPFIGAVLGELASGKSVLRASHVGAATWIGFLVGTLVRLVLVFAMVGLFVLAYLF